MYFIASIKVAILKFSVMITIVSSSKLPKLCEADWQENTHCIKGMFDDMKDVLHLLSN